MPATAWGSIHILYDEYVAQEHRVTVSEDGKQVHCYIEAVEGQKYAIRAVTLPFFKASIHVFIDGQWNEGRILAGGLVGILQGRTVGENQFQPFLFAPAKTQPLDPSQPDAEKDLSRGARAGTIIVELWHVEIVGETKPVNWNAMGQQFVVPEGAKETDGLSHTTSFGDKMQDERVGSTVMITRPIFSEPFLVITFEYMSRELLEKKGLLESSTEASAPMITYNDPTRDARAIPPVPSHSIADVTPKQSPSLGLQEAASKLSCPPDISAAVAAAMDSTDRVAEAAEH